MNTISNYLKSRGIETVLILVLAFVALWPRIEHAKTTPTPPNDIAPLQYSYPASWSNRTIVRTAVEHCSNSWFETSWYFQDKPIVNKIGGNSYAISYQKGIGVSAEKGSARISDIIYFRSTIQPGAWELKSFQYTDPMLLRMAQSEIEDIEGVVYAQAFVTRNGDKKTIDLYCFPGK